MPTARLVPAQKRSGPVNALGFVSGSPPAQPSRRSRSESTASESSSTGRDAGSSAKRRRNGGPLDASPGRALTESEDDEAEDEARKAVKAKVSSRLRSRIQRRLRSRDRRGRGSAVSSRVKRLQQAHSTQLLERRCTSASSGQHQQVGPKAEVTESESSRSQETPEPCSTGDLQGSPGTVAALDKVLGEAEPSDATLKGAGEADASRAAAAMAAAAAVRARAKDARLRQRTQVASAAGLAASAATTSRVPVADGKQTKLPQATETTQRQAKRATDTKPATTTAPAMITAHSENAEMAATDATRLVSIAAPTASIARLRTQTSAVSNVQATPSTSSSSAAGEVTAMSCGSPSLSPELRDERLAELSSLPPEQKLAEALPHSQLAEPQHQHRPQLNNPQQTRQQKRQQNPLQTTHSELHVPCQHSRLQKQHLKKYLANGRQLSLLQQKQASDKAVKRQQLLQRLVAMKRELRAERHGLAVAEEQQAQQLNEIANDLRVSSKGIKSQFRSLGSRICKAHQDRAALDRSFKALRLQHTELQLAFARQLLNLGNRQSALRAAAGSSWPSSPVTGRRAGLADEERGEEAKEDCGEDATLMGAGKTEGQHTAEQSSGDLDTDDDPDVIIEVTQDAELTKEELHAQEQRACMLERAAWGETRTTDPSPDSESLR
ncbi:unnamed protein product [Polarella glacialis]|uniref:Uncharacterized protein n=1 Tax=Polarella glacialis TaxID=89957 RepID=A0A813LH51_POLGL|nr:unnamed protein product [Polarella glacialis]CAE8725948.1 unnamed protein product [Polarella glacialis]